MPRSEAHGPGRIDNLSPDQRRAAMQAVRSQNTRPELLVRQTAHRMGLRFRLGRCDLPGSPDLVFPRYRLAVFVHGCFWHTHTGCSRATTPRTRLDYWLPKFARTVERDARAEEALKRMGWKVLVLWECSLRDVPELERQLARATHGRD
ncbi:very short patch repair endonuclease [Nitrosovibrio sp. Nv17]|uniref:very short patch repair endonuclease n=1 Tax=Nitrosovibrio sp. Nv17 TaxID=1855339 RepID=UPI0009307DCB|nr:very short patch repair endonuclease [Nitrosovibrio sp. Nv17]